MSRLPRRRVVAVLAVVVLATTAACGGERGVGGGEPTAPSGPSAAIATASASASATIGPSAGTAPAAGMAPAAGTAPAATTAAPGTAPASTAAPAIGAAALHVEMKTPVATALVTDLAALGLDANALPPLEKIDARALRGVMKLISRSLGVRCGDCHEESDFAAATPRKKIARRMWNDFVAELSTSDGAPIFCDSCHKGRLVQLDRTDPKALSDWMDRAFVGMLARKDGQPNACETCHVDDKMRFLADWAR